METTYLDRCHRLIHLVDDYFKAETEVAHCNKPNSNQSPEYKREHTIKMSHFKKEIKEILPLLK